MYSVKTKESQMMTKPMAPILCWPVPAAMPRATAMKTKAVSRLSFMMVRKRTTLMAPINPKATATAEEPLTFRMTIITSVMMISIMTSVCMKVLLPCTPRQKR